MAVRRIFAGICIVAMVVTGLGVAIFLFSRPDTTTAAPSSVRSPLPPVGPKLPTPEEFQIDVQVSAHQCTQDQVCTYTYTVKPTYIGLHRLPDQGFGVSYEVTGGTQPQQGNFTISDGQARVYTNVTVEGPAGAQLQARATQISPALGPRPVEPGTFQPAQPSAAPAN
ncbi:hypothetical protein FR943_09820 [Mycobacterium sp. TNTM28]|uniref:Uncharacterized protein n=1 Tax=[Mycobacterium] fortunisiensis TaxID=2600579 RepID=A0ABS6KKN7_9MYCO|nr:hypothetical protein [[Mycobacterium] fortunisiensis]MBU9764137.1 hypothetical protein [[Mycobacterium] fortunisiensis]